MQWLDQYNLVLSSLDTPFCFMKIGSCNCDDCLYTQQEIQRNITMSIEAMYKVY
jgi:hypothetical protein